MIHWVWNSSRSLFSLHGEKRMTEVGMESKEERSSKRSWNMKRKEAAENRRENREESICRRKRNEHREKNRRERRGVVRGGQESLSWRGWGKEDEGTRGVNRKELTLEILSMFFPLSSFFLTLRVSLEQESRREREESRHWKKRGWQESSFSSFPFISSPRDRSKGSILLLSFKHERLNKGWRCKSYFVEQV